MYYLVISSHYLKYSAWWGKGETKRPPSVKELTQAAEEAFRQQPSIFCPIKIGPMTEKCPICNRLVPVVTIDEHVSQCIVEFERKKKELATKLIHLQEFQRPKSHAPSKESSKTVTTLVHVSIISLLNNLESFDLASLWRIFEEASKISHMEVRTFVDCTDLAYQLWCESASIIMRNNKWEALNKKFSNLDREEQTKFVFAQLGQPIR